MTAHATNTRRALAAALLSVAMGCSSPDDVISDASIDVQTSDATTDASADATSDRMSTDAPTSDAPTNDAPTNDAPTSDAPAVDTPVADAMFADVIAPMDAGVDVPRADVIVPTDTGIDVPRADVIVPTDTGVDVTRVDTGVVDVPVADTGCGGAFTVSVTAPTAELAIETCTVSGMPVYYNFTAVPSGPATSVEFAWRTPEGTLAPPPWPAITTAPFVARRQVGGTMVDVPPLAVLSRRGTWHVEVVARDRCGRTAMASQAFTLIFTNRDCPNP